MCSPMLCRYHPPHPERFCTLAHFKSEINWMPLPTKPPLCLLTARRWAYLCGPAFTPSWAMSGFCISSPFLCHSQSLHFYRSQICPEGLRHTFRVSLDMRTPSKWETRLGGRCWGGGWSTLVRSTPFWQAVMRQGEKGQASHSKQQTNVLFLFFCCSGWCFLFFLDQAAKTEIQLSS